MFPSHSVVHIAEVTYEIPGASLSKPKDKQYNLFCLFSPLLSFLGHCHKQNLWYCCWVCSKVVSYCYIFTTAATCFPECQMHSGKPSPSPALGEELPGVPLTVKRASPSVENRALGEELTLLVPSVFFFEKILFPECNTRGRNLFFLKKTIPRVLIPCTRGRNLPV
jgi:hypothetical protein